MYILWNSRALIRCDFFISRAGRLSAKILNEFYVRVVSPLLNPSRNIYRPLSKLFATSFTLFLRRLVETTVAYYNQASTFDGG